MFQRTKKHKKCFVTEEDISILLQRYTASTVLGVLQEVAQVADSKIDWNALVRNTATEITNAREYQMLWRHLAYGHGLLDKFDDAAQPLDDDSDLEYELEASPAVSNEASAEAAACVKVLIASAIPNDSNMPSGTTVDAPLTINMPNGQTSRPDMENSFHGTTYMQRTNITAPVAVQKQSLSNAEGLDTTQAPASANLPRRKRKPWSDAEDMELIAAVQRCGEGNWANILKGDFKGDRTASQLSQRWAIIRKRKTPVVGNSSQLSEAQLAANRAMSLAIGDKSKAASPYSTAGGPNLSGGHNSSHSVAADIASAGAKSQHQQDPFSKPWVAPKVALPKPTTSPDSFVKAAAVSTGVRIANPSSAASVLKTNQSKTIVPGGGSAVKSHVPGSTNGLPSNVHFIRTGLVSRSTGSSNALRPGTQQVAHHILKPTSTAVQSNRASTPSRPNTSAKTNARKSAPATELEVNTKQVLQKNKPTALSNAQSEKLADRGAFVVTALPSQVQRDRTPALGNPLTQCAEDKSLFLGDSRKECKQEDRDSCDAKISGSRKEVKAIAGTENGR